MKINGQTRISELIKHNAASIDAIASLSKPLRKLRNPILRKLMASRTTIREAAKIGGCSLAEFQRVLQPLGFHFSEGADNADMARKNLPEWLADLPGNRIHRFDVRDILEKGKDPLKQILDTFKEIAPGNALCVVNAFEPVPLLRLLEKNGVKTHTVVIQPKEYHSFFYKEDTSLPPAPTGVSSDGPVVVLDAQAFQEVINTFERDQIKEIDVRQLEMPAPMQTILALLPDLERGQALYVNHKRFPIYLLEEIASQDYIINILNVSEGDVKLFIWRK